MARKPNYKFDRLQRERAKAEKKAARLEEKKKRTEERSGDAGPADTDDSDMAPAED